MKGASTTRGVTNLTRAMSIGVRADWPMARIDRAKADHMVSVTTMAATPAKALAERSAGAVSTVMGAG
jgi:hypothetical protein